MLRNLQRLPDYTCLQTIDRKTLKVATEAEQIDRLRFEIAYVGRKELVAWPGEGKFEQRALENLASLGGALGSGDFALHIRNLCAAAPSAFSGPTEELRGARKTLRWDLQLQKGEIGMQVGSTQDSELVPYHGSFWVDAETLDLIRLEVHADQIPKRIGISAAGGTIEYASSRIGDSDFLLPVVSELTMTEQSGQDFRNISKFTGCRQFVGQSSISFADQAAEDRPAVEPRRVRVLPPGLTAEVELKAGIDLTSAAVGDPVQAVLVRPLRNGKEIIYPRGSKLEGRITRLQRRRIAEHPPYYVVGLRFSGVAGEGVESEFQASLEDLMPAGTVYFLPRRGMLLIDPNFRPQLLGESVSWLAPPEPGEGVFLAKVRRIFPGLRLQWRTLDSVR